MVKQNLKMVKCQPYPTTHPSKYKNKVMSILHVPIKNINTITQHGLYTQENI